MLLLTTWSFGLRAGASAWRMLEEGCPAIDAVEATCVAAEDDEGVDSVGFGGLPDRDGRVTLDGCVMLSARRCGSVCAVARCRHPVSLARRVMERTPHVMLAGAGADAFAAEQGMASEHLLAPAAEASWRAWRAGPADDGGAAKSAEWTRDGGGGLRPIDRGPDAGGALFDRGGGRRIDPNRHHDTIGVLAIDRHGSLAGACSTSGTPYKRPGRVGDSPIIGHGLYVDPEVGAATATGAGELIMGVCGSVLVVEAMRRGSSPRDAVRGALERILSAGPLEPHHQVAFLALHRDGRWSSGALRPGYKTTVFQGAGGQVVGPEVELLADEAPRTGPAPAA